MEGINRERALVELFGALEGRYGPNYECKYYPCHFDGQDCSFCFCPFYPCFNYELGMLKKTTKGYVWSCKDCNWIHEKDVVEKVLEELSAYPRQKLVEEDWIFFNRIFQKIYHGREIGYPVGKSYVLMNVGDNYEKCEVKFLAVKLKNFEILDVEEGKDTSNLKELEAVIIPVYENGYLFGFKAEGDKFEGIKWKL